MKTMTMEKAVKYSLNKDIVIHVPTQELWDSLENYVKKNNLPWLSRNWFPEYGYNTCIKLSTTYTQYCGVDWYHDKGYEIIELESPDEITITINSDGHKVVSASCNDITIEAKCSDTDTFNLSKGTHMALERLINKMNESAKSNKIGKGDIVELLPTDHTAPKEFIGLQGIVVENDSVPYVKFPISISGGRYHWACIKKDLKLIRKASK